MSDSILTVLKTENQGDNFLHSICDCLGTDVFFGSTSESLADYFRLRSAAEAMSKQAEAAERDSAAGGSVDQEPDLFTPTLNAWDVVDQADEYAGVVGLPDAGNTSAMRDPVSSDYSDEYLTQEILKLALVKQKAWHALRRVFLEHKHPEGLDPLGKRIRSILISLGDNDHGSKEG